MSRLKTNVRKKPSRKEGELDYRAEYSKMLSDWTRSWKEALNPSNMTGDLLAGVTVAAIALPLNLALAVACGLPPAAGLLAGAIGGGVAAIFGGARFQVTGPAAALNVMILMIVKDFGPEGAAVAALVTGVICLALGALLAGKIVKFVPEAVLAGFTTGVGLKLLDQQIPELLGFNYKVTELAAMMHRPTWLHEVSWLSVVCGMFVAMLVVTTKHLKRFPAALIGVTIVTALSVYLNWDIERVGEIPPVFPTARFPLVADDQWLPLILRAIPLGLLGAVESLLSAQILDRMSAPAGYKPHNSNLELVGQGMANLTAGMFGAMTVTGVVVRSSANFQSGARTRLSSLIHGAILLFSVLYLSDSLAKIPLAGLAGMLCVIGLRLIEIKELKHLLHVNKVAAAAFLVTMAGTVSGRLVEGLAGGLALYFAHELLTRGRRKAKEMREQQRAQGVRAILGAERSEARRPVGHYAPSPSAAEWIGHVRDRARIPASAYVHPDATVIGRVVLGDNVHVAADTSIRADEGTPFFIGANSNVQDGVVLHALKERHVKVGAESWAIYVGKNVSMAHQALVHGPSYIGDNTFIGFKAVVHDSIVGSGCFIGIGAVVVGVEIPDGKFVPHGMIVDSADKVDGLPSATHAHAHFNEDVVEVNRGLAAAYRDEDGARSAGLPPEAQARVPRAAHRHGTRIPDLTASRF